MARMYHKVVEGDTLYSIAQKYNTTVKALQDLNGINANILDIGELLIVSDDGYTGETLTSTSTKAVVDRFGLIANSDRGMYAGWKWNKENTDHYEYIWYYSWGVGVAVEEKGETTSDNCTFTAPDHATHVSFIVRPVAKTYKTGTGQNETEVAYWTAEWSTKKTYYFSHNPPKAPNAPSVKIEDYTLTATFDNLQDLNANMLNVQVIRDNGRLHFEDNIPIVTYHASFTCDIEPGHEYKVRARSMRDGMYSDWSGYSDNYNTKPIAPSGITTLRVVSSTSIYLEWTAVANADSYDIQYAEKLEYFNSNQATTVSDITSTSYTLAGLESGKTYFFRVRASNSVGDSDWSGAKSTVIGKRPSPPTTWSSTTTAIVGEPLYLYWVHNSEDGSKQTMAKIELDVNGTVSEINSAPQYKEDDEEKTCFYEFDTSGYTEGTTLKWRVQTCGVTGEYSDWSMQRVVEIYAKPTLSLTLLDGNGDILSTLTRFPFTIDAVAGPNTQKPIGYHVSIMADESYETVDQLGNRVYVSQNGEVYSKYFDISEDLSTTLYPNDIDLENNIAYTVKCVVSMNSGLTGEASARFDVAWTDELYEPNAEIGINKDTYSAIIRPYCTDVDGALADVTLSVYRRTYDGSYVKIATNLENTMGIFVVDPHPPLDLARYRIVAVSQSTGSVSYTDVGQGVGGSAAIIQWAEEWSDFNVTDTGVIAERPWTGSMLKLPYNIDVSMSNAIDVAHVEYVGRKHPVGYYGTQLGETASWRVDIPKNDKETLYALRRLAMWPGDVYVREPSGSGYWATVTVSYNIDHCKVVIPVSFEITRVEGNESRVGDKSYSSTGIGQGSGVGVAIDVYTKAETRALINTAITQAIGDAIGGSY